MPFFYLPVLKSGCFTQSFAGWISGRDVRCRAGESWAAGWLKFVKCHGRDKYSSASGCLVYRWRQNRSIRLCTMLPAVVPSCCGLPWNGSLPAGTGKSTDVDLTDVNKLKTWTARPSMKQGGKGKRMWTDRVPEPYGRLYNKVGKENGNSCTDRTEQVNKNK